MMKKLFAMLLVLCSVLTFLCSCAGNGNDGTSDSTDSGAAVGTGEFANDNEASYHSSWKVNQ